MMDSAKPGAATGVAVKARVLIVEDEAILAMDLARQVARFGHHALESVATGEQAIERARAERPDLILMDIQLAGAIDGIAAAEAILAFLDVPMIYLSAFSEDERLQRAELTHPSAYLVKPARETDLRAAITMALHRHRVDRELRASEERYRAVMEGVRDVIFAIDAAGRWTFLSPAWAIITGFAVAPSLGRPLLEWVHPQDTECEAALARVQAQSSDEFLQIDIRLRHRDGDTRWIEMHARRSADTAGVFTGATGVLRDVTQRHAQDLQLRQLSLAVEQSSESIVITDLEATIEYANAAALVTSGYTRADLIGRNARVLQSGKTAPETYRGLWENLTSGRPWKGILRNRRKDGSDYTEFAVITPIRLPGGRVTHYVAVKEDVTEKRRMGEELDQHRHHLEELVEQRTAELALAKQAAEAANQAKSAFLAAMSHEIRTPMNGVVGIVDVLRQSSLSPYQSDLADTIRESAFALLGIIDDILDFSKIEANRVALEHEPVALLRLIEGVCDGLQPVAASSGVHLQVFVDPRLPGWITSDAVRLRQVLNNLLGNAIKFSAGQAHAGRVQVRADADAGERLRLTVSDNGIGMAADAQARIFQPFEQGEGSTTRRYGGTGLGLSICHRLVQLFGGTIEVASAPGEGARFTVMLPLQVPAAQPAAPPDRGLAGLACHVVMRDMQQTRDWCAYLAADGAQASAWPDVAALQEVLLASDGASTVAIVEGDGDDEAPARLRVGLAGAPVRLVRVGDGQRRRPRLLGPGVASLDADAVHRSALRLAVALAAGRAVPQPDEVAEGLPIGTIVPPNVDDAVAQGRLVLVAEDNDINQRVIRRQLALLGLAAELADDGLDALARWRRNADRRRYGLLLTDLHMPGMDGYELSATIRAEEPQGRRLPIIALTANALSGEAERCRAAGMDDYLSKPVQLEQLSATLARWLPAVPAAAIVAAPTAPVLRAVDGAVLVQLIGNEPALLTQVRREYLDSARLAAAELRGAAAQGDWATVRAVAHRLKSSSRAVGALALAVCCDDIEHADPAGDSTSRQALLSRFHADWAAAEAALADEQDASVVAGPAAAAVPGVVLVDDDRFQLQVLQRQLTTLGVTAVEACCSGALALEQLQGRDTSALLLLLDLNMPDMDGVEFMRHLGERRYAGALALVSGADERVLETAAKLATAYQLNVLSHLHKPVAPVALRGLIERWHGFIPARARQGTKAYGPREIERAIQGGELLLHYQPKVALGDGALVGVEALVRWQHPEDGLLFPDSFIAVAEAQGLIDALTRAVLTQALAQARRWRDNGLALRVAVNISMDNLARLDFSEFVLDEAARHGVAPTDLVLEVTESRLMHDVRAPMDILTRLRLKHIGLSIDDFGTGHSSLAQLRDIPFDELKIDRGFVHGSHEQATQRAIFMASLEMAHQLGMKAVAEGVEDRADWDFVRAAGCDVAQGYFVARPMPPDALPGWATQWRQRFDTL